MSVESRILRHLKENPGATPRLIADALGLPLNQVRIALNRLRDAGYVVRVPGEGYYARVPAEPADLGEADTGPGAGLSGGGVSGAALRFEKLSEVVEQLVERVGKLEKEVKEIRVTLDALVRSSQEPRSRAQAGQGSREDPVLRELKARKVMKVGELASTAARPLEEYVRTGSVVVISDVAVDADFYNSFLNRFPIKKLDAVKLSSEERELMNAMIREGVVYLYGGREYRLTSRT